MSELRPNYLIGQASVREKRTPEDSIRLQQSSGGQSHFHQPIANTSLRREQNRISWVRLQLFPQSRHINPQILGLSFVLRAPDFAKDLLMRQHLAGVLDK